MRHKNCLCINFSVSCHLILDISALPFTPTKWGSTFIPSSVQLPARRGSSSHPAPAAPPWTDTQQQDSPSPGSCPTPRRWCDGPAPCASLGCAASYRSDCTAGRAAHCPDASQCDASSWSCPCIAAHRPGTSRRCRPASRLAAPFCRLLACPGWRSRSLKQEGESWERGELCANGPKKELRWWPVGGQQVLKYHRPLSYDKRM